MRILVAVASKHGSNRAIAESIAAVLAESGHHVDLRDVSTIRTLANYDAAIVGSAIYIGRWMSEARDFYQEHLPALAGMPVWLFSSGPLSDTGAEHGLNAGELDEMISTLKARDHTMFSGNLDPSELDFGERMMTRVVKAPTGDFRDWDAIHRWATGIADALQEHPVKTAAG